MTPENLGKNIEIIDNEKINNKLDNKEENIALGILKMIDIQVPNIDIDLAYDKNEKNYYFIVNNKALNIPLKLEKLVNLGKVLIELFNNNIQLSGDLYLRSIIKDSWVLDGFEQKYIQYKDFGLNKNDIEELFVFIMNAKNINIDNWKIKNAICKGEVSQKCKENLGK